MFRGEKKKNTHITPFAIFNSGFIIGLIFKLFRILEALLSAVQRDEIVIMTLIDAVYNILNLYERGTSHSMNAFYQ